MKNFVFICIVFICGSAMLVQTEFDAMAIKYGKGKAPFIKPEKLEEWTNGAEEICIIDTRENKEFRISHIQGAHCTGYDNLSLNYVEKNFPKNAKIVCYCSVGYRSAKVAEKLIKKGYKNVYNLYGGLFNWVNKGFAVVDAKGEETKKVHAYNKEWGKWLYKGVKIYE